MKRKKSIAKILTSAGIIALASVSATAVDASEAVKGKFYTAYETEEEAVQAAVELQTRIAAEGDALLKNKDNALPLKSDAKISVFGGRQNNVLGASKSSGGMSSGSGGIGLCTALAESGFNVNPTLQNFYEANSTSIGKENSEFNGRVESSLGVYNDAAVVLFSREGGEGSDASRVTSEQVDESDFDHQALYKDEDGKSYKHYLMLTKEEKNLLKYVKDHFSKVVVVINSSNAMELSQLKEDEGISAIVTIGRPGEGGMYGLAQILNGTVSPSGSLVDEWMTDFTTDPTWYNFGSNNQSAKFEAVEGQEKKQKVKGSGENSYYYQDGTKTGVTGSSTAHDNEGYHGVDYEEGIYLGYKYYETVYTEIAEGNLKYDPSQPVGQQLSENGTSTGLTPENIASANAWWAANVAYAYGYGLTYTSFSFNIQGLYKNENCSAALPATGLAEAFASTATKAADIKTIYVKVTVKNTGDVAGKKTVQLYATAPYTKGGVEKASVSLVGFGKTSLLQPGESEDVVVAVNVQDIASYDYKNLSGAVGADGGYVLEAGTYTLRAMDNSHFDYATDKADAADAYDEKTFEVATSVELVQDDYSGNAVSNLFSAGSVGTGSFVNADATTTDILSGTTEQAMHDLRFNSVRSADLMAEGGTGMTVLSRGSMVSSFPVAPTLADHTFKNSVLNYFAYWDTFRVSTEYKIDNSGNPTDQKVKDASRDYASDPWYISAEDIPANWNQATGTYDANHKVAYNRTTKAWPMNVSTATEQTIKFIDMVGVAYGDAKWDQFLNQLTYDELCTVIEFGGYCTVDIPSVGKAKSADTDGPNNLDGTVAWTSEDILAGTFNVDLAREEGEVMGNIGLLHGVQGWYGPGADTHRSPFSGRNNEYYSQDGLHAGYIGAAEVQGVQSTGVIPYIKHCLMNDMETDRGTMFVWADEQTIRESGAKQFQIILQEGECKAAMTGYARLCGLNNTNNYNLGVELYQKQWGSQAYFVTDGYIGWRTRTDLDSMVRTGNQMELYTTPYVEYLSGEWRASTTEGGQGMVYVEDLNSDAADHMVASPTQWYWVRQSAKSILFQVANSAGQFNGYSELNLVGGKIDATEGQTVSGSVSVANSLSKGSSAVYSSSNLPSGLTLDANTGALGGSIAKAGTYNFDVECVIDGWISKTGSYQVVVAPAFRTEGDDVTDAKAGEDFLIEIKSSVYTTDQYESITYTVKSGKLPEGLTLSEDGIISGTPTEPGVYTVVINVKTVKSGGSSGSGGWGGKGLAFAGDKGGGDSKTEENIEYTLTITVKGEVAPVVDPLDVAKAELQAKIDELNAKLATAATKEEQTIISNQIAELQNQVKALDGNVASKNTTAPVVLAVIALVVAVAACGATAFVVLKKKN